MKHTQNTQNAGVNALATTKKNSTVEHFDLPNSWSPSDWAVKAREAHIGATTSAQTAIRYALQCGQLLLSAKSKTKGGNWELFLDSTEIPRVSAWRYMALADANTAKAIEGQPLLESGGTLTDLYRSLGIVKERAGGGHRANTSDATPARRPLFDACIFETSLRLLTDDATDLSDLPSAQLHGQRDLLTTAIARLDNELANRAGIAERGES